jgi:hypothetical protein
MAAVPNAFIVSGGKTVIVTESLLEAQPMLSTPETPYVVVVDGVTEKEDPTPNPLSQVKV